MILTPLCPKCSSASLCLYCSLSDIHHLNNSSVNQLKKTHLQFQHKSTHAKLKSIPKNLKIPLLQIHMILKNHAYWFIYSHGVLPIWNNITCCHEILECKGRQEETKWGKTQNDSQNMLSEEWLLACSAKKERVSTFWGKQKLQERWTQNYNKKSTVMIKTTHTWTTGKRHQRWDIWKGLLIREGVRISFRLHLCNETNIWKWEVQPGFSCHKSFPSSQSEYTDQAPVHLCLNGEVALRPKDDHLNDTLIVSPVIILAETSVLPSALVITLDFRSQGVLAQLPAANVGTESAGWPVLILCYQY